MSDDERAETSDLDDDSAFYLEDGGPIDGGLEDGGLVDEQAPRERDSHAESGAPGRPERPERPAVGGLDIAMYAHLLRESPPPTLSFLQIARGARAGFSEQDAEVIATTPRLLEHLRALWTLEAPPPAVLAVAAQRTARGGAVRRLLDETGHRNVVDTRPGSDGDPKLTYLPGPSHSVTIDLGWPSPGDAPADPRQPRVGQIGPRWRTLPPLDAVLPPLDEHEQQATLHVEATVDRDRQVASVHLTVWSAATDRQLRLTLIGGDGTRRSVTASANQQAVLDDVPLAALAGDRLSIQVDPAPGLQVQAPDAADDAAPGTEGPMPRAGRSWPDASAEPAEATGPPAGGAQVLPLKPRLQRFTLLVAASMALVVLAGAVYFGLTLNSSSPAGSVSTAPVSAVPEPFAADAFDRQTSDGLGRADQGGEWTVSGTPAEVVDYATAAGQAHFTLSRAGVRRTAYLGSVQKASSDVTAVAVVDKPIKGGAVYLSVIGRQLGFYENYLADLRIDTHNEARLLLSSNTDASTNTVLSPNIILPGTVSPGDQIRIRVQVFGTAPTTIRAKAWYGTAAEPAGWLLSVTDAAPALQQSGSVGFTTYVSQAATNPPITVSLLDFTARPVAQ